MQHVRKDGGAQTCHWHCDTVLLKELARIIAAPKALPWEVDGTLKGQSEALRLRMHHVLDSGLLLRGCAGCGCGCCAVCVHEANSARSSCRPHVRRADRLAWQQPRLGLPPGAASQPCTAVAAAGCAGATCCILLQHVVRCRNAFSHVATVAAGLLRRCNPELKGSLDFFEEVNKVYNKEIKRWHELGERVLAADECVRVSTRGCPPSPSARRPSLHQARLSPTNGPHHLHR